jgi:hypothetical protein
MVRGWMRTVVVGLGIVIGDAEATAGVRIAGAEATLGVKIGTGIGDVEAMAGVVNEAGMADMAREGSVTGAVHAVGLDEGLAIQDAGMWVIVAQATKEGGWRVRDADSMQVMMLGTDRTQVVARKKPLP